MKIHRRSFIKTLAAATAVSAVLSLFSACASSEGTDPDEGGADAGSAVGLVPSSADFGGARVRVLCVEDGDTGRTCEIAADLTYGETVCAATEKRNEQAQKFLNVEIVMNSFPPDALLDNYKSNALAGRAETSDVIMLPATEMADPSLLSTYENVYDLPYVGVDLSSDCFARDLGDELGAGGKLYFLVGDLDLSALASANVLFFNKQLLRDAMAEDLYQLTREGVWTVDKMAEICRGIYSDVNGDSQKDGNDRYGYVSESDALNALYAQFDVRPTEPGENGIPKLSIDEGKMVSVLEKMTGIFNSPDAYAASDANSGALPEIFTQNRALFYAGALDTARSFRELETDFGILPFPKWNARQEGYYTQSRAGYTAVAVPRTAADKELCGAFLDVMFTLSRDVVVPEYCDALLNDKYSRDDETGEMLTTIRDGLRLNFGTFYPIGFSRIIEKMIGDNNPNFVTYYSSNVRDFEKRLDATVAAITE